ncbi:hypothetical protein MNEG_10474, partial [Monoraphidium neglectum]
MARAAAAQTVVSHAEALLDLANVLHTASGTAHSRSDVDSGGSQGSTCSATAHGADGADGGPGAARAAEAASREVERWQGQLAVLQEQLHAGAGSGDGGGGATDSGQSPSSGLGEGDGHQAPPPPLAPAGTSRDVHWWPADIPVMRGSHSLTLEGFRGAALDALRHFGCLLP